MQNQVFEKRSVLDLTIRFGTMAVPPAPKKRSRVPVSNAVDSVHGGVCANERLVGMPLTCVNDVWHPHVQTKHESMAHEVPADHTRRTAFATHDSG